MDGARLEEIAKVVRLIRRPFVGVRLIAVGSDDLMHNARNQIERQRTNDHVGWSWGLGDGLGLCGKKLDRLQHGLGCGADTSDASDVGARQGLPRMRIELEAAAEGVLVPEPGKAQEQVRLSTR